MSNRERYVQAWNRAFNDGDVDAFAGMLSPNYVRHYRRSPGFSNIDSEGLRSVVAAVRRGFPDITSQIEDIVGDDNEFAVRWSSSGTHLHEFLGVPATGRVVSTEGITVCRFEGDLVQEEWVAWDLPELLKSLGINDLRAPPQPHSEAVAEQSVRAVHGKFPTGVTVVAGIDGNGKPYGLVVNAFMSVSLAPPTILVCIGRSSRSHDRFLSAKAFSVNILAADQADIARTFASAAPDKFTGIGWQLGELDVPLLTDCAASFEARIAECVRASTHTLIVGLVTSARSSERPPLIYMGGALYDSADLQPINRPGAES